MLSSVKSYIIAFVVASLIFGVIFVAFLPQIKSLAEGFLNPGEAESAETDEETYYVPDVPDPNTGITETKAVFEDHRSFTLLLIGSDYQPDVFNDYRVSVKNKTDMEQLAKNQRHYKADVAVLVRYCAENGTFIMSAIPTNAVVSSAGIDKLCDVLERRGAAAFTELVSGIVGMPIDYYICCRISLFIEIINRFGGVRYDVPVNMNYVNEEERIVQPGASREPKPKMENGEPVLDDEGNPVMELPGQPFRINLSRGMQKLNGEKASWVLRYNSYPNGFLSRRDTQTSFFRTLFESVLNEEKHSVLYGVISLINSSSAGETNLTAAEFEELSTTILSYEKYDKTIVQFPCSVSGSGDNEKVSFARNAVYAAFEKYKIQ